MFFIKHKLVFLAISVVITVVGLVLWGVFGLPYGIDFTGGSLMEVRYASPAPTTAQIQQELSSLNLGDLSIQSADNNGFIIRLKDINEDTHHQMVTALQKLAPTTEPKTLLKTSTTKTASQPQVQALDQNGNPVNVNITAVPTGTSTTTDTTSNFEELRFESVGPAVGAELKQKASVAIVLTLIAIVIYVAWAFRRVSQPVASWKYGIITILALLHDIILPIGIFALLGYLGKAEIGAAFVAALLTILGYSVNDTIVVFDRIRENLIRDRGETFYETVGMSLDQTIIRSLNTTFTVLLTLIAVYFFGGESVRLFALALIIGVASGAYSSIFIASPLLVVVEEWQRKSGRK